MFSPHIPQECLRIKRLGGAAVFTRDEGCLQRLKLGFVFFQ